MESQNQLPSSEALQKGTTFTRTCINGINVLAGVGILSTPYALAQGGWLSLIFLFIMAAICGYTGILLQRCMDKNPSVTSYPDIGGLAFGPKGKILVSIFVCMELYLVAVEFLILEGDNLQKLFPSHGFEIGSVRVGGKEMYMVGTAVAIMPTTWLTSLGLLAYVSFGGVLASVVLIVCVAWEGAGEGFGSNGQRYDLFRYQGLPTSLSLMAFCFCAHAVFPMLCNSMKNKAQFPKVLLVCFVVSATSYGSIAILGYQMYGKDIKSQVTLNLPIDKLSTKIAIYATLINPIAKYAATTNPIAIAIEDAFALAATRTTAILIRTLLLVTALIVALSVPFFAYVMAFTGAFLSVATTILIPCSCYLKINNRARQFGLELMVIVGIIVLGVTVCIVGTFSSVEKIVKHL